MDHSPLDSSVHGDSPGKNTGVGGHALLQEVVPTRGSNLRLLTFPTLAGGFLSTSAAWEAFCPSGLTINMWEGGLELSEASLSCRGHRYNSLLAS